MARFVVDLSIDAVPADVRTAASQLALNTLGSALAVAREDFRRAALAVAERLGGAPKSLLLGTRVRVAAANAVLACIRRRRDAEPSPFCLGG